MDLISQTCFYCGELNEDVRPYGPGGAWVCYPCAMASPERLESTTRAYFALLEAAGAMSPDGLVAIGENEGPRPAEIADLLPPN